MNSLKKIELAIRDVPDFPKKGIMFKDISPVLADAELFASTIKLLAEQCEGKQIDFVTGIEARGFIFGAALARELKCGFVPIRKPGKLPYKVYREEYALEYGRDSVEVHQDAFFSKANVYLVDDLLATGGTAQAAVRLIEKCDAKVELIGFMIELAFLKGRDKINNYPVKSLLTV